MVPSTRSGSKPCSRGRSRSELIQPRLVVAVDFALTDVVVGTAGLLLVLDSVMIGSAYMRSPWPGPYKPQATGSPSTKKAASEHSPVRERGTSFQPVKLHPLQSEDCAELLTARETMPSRTASQGSTLTPLLGD